MKTISTPTFEDLRFEVQTICSLDIPKYDMPDDEDTYTGLTLTSTVFI